MGSNPTKAANNMYCKCRLAAAKYNDKLNSRDGAAEMLGLSSSTLASYELNLTKVVPVESIMMMADVYNAPELKIGTVPMFALWVLNFRKSKLRI